VSGAVVIDVIRARRVTADHRGVLAMGDNRGMRADGFDLPDSSAALPAGDEARRTLARPPERRDPSDIGPAARVDTFDVTDAFDVTDVFDVTMEFETMEIETMEIETMEIETMEIETMDVERDELGVRLTRPSPAAQVSA